MICNPFPAQIVVGTIYLPGNTLRAAVIKAVVIRFALVMASLAKGNRSQAKTTEKKERAAQSYWLPHDVKIPFQALPTRPVCKMPPTQNPLAQPPVPNRQRL